MPPKTKISEAMIIDAGFRLVREEGIGALNVRSVSSKLNCSTQPVMHHFATVGLLKQAIYRRADAYHTEYLLSHDAGVDDPMLSIGLRYIRFAVEEKNLFRFLFQSDHFTNESLSGLLHGDATLPMVRILQQEADLAEEQSREVFGALFIAAHGFASLLANNVMQYSEADCAGSLEMIFRGLIRSKKEE